MTTSDKALVLLLRFVGVGSLFALVAVFIPSSWMVAIHRWLGLGEMPTAPVVEYLARSLSAFYAFFGALCLVMAADLERYRPLVRFLGLALVVLGVVFTGVDLAAGMPWWWTASEGAGGVVFGALESARLAWFQSGSRFVSGRPLSDRVASSGDDLRRRPVKGARRILLCGSLER